MNKSPSPINPTDESVDAATDTTGSKTTDVPSRELTFTELKTLVQSHPAYLRRQQCFDSKRRTPYEKAVRAEAVDYEVRWLRSLSVEKRQEMAAWSRQRIRLAVDEAYNTATDAGTTVTSSLLLDDAIGDAIDYWKARTRQYHLRVQAERKAKAAMKAATFAPQATPVDGWIKQLNETGAA